jgi:hypothetical protein
MPDQPDREPAADNPAVDNPAVDNPAVDNPDRGGADEAAAADEAPAPRAPACANCGALEGVVPYRMHALAPGSLGAVLSGEAPREIVVQTALLCPRCRNAARDLAGLVRAPGPAAALGRLLPAGAERAALLAEIGRELPDHADSHRLAGAVVNVLGEAVYHLARRFPEAAVAEVVCAAQGLLLLALARRAEEVWGRPSKTAVH